MAVNKVAYGSNVLIDLSADTLSSAAQIAKGIIGHLRDGTQVTGTMTSGGGGLPSNVQAIDSGSITISADFTTTRQTFQHNLGVVPDLVMVFATANVATTYSMLFAIRSTLMGYRSSAYNAYLGYHGNSTTTVTMTNTNSTTYGVSNMTASSFQLASASTSYYWRKGTYMYIAIKFA